VCGDHIGPTLALTDATLGSVVSREHRRKSFLRAVFRESIIRIYDTKHTRRCCEDLLLRFKEAGLYIGVRIDR